MDKCLGCEWHWQKFLQLYSSHINVGHITVESLCHVYTFLPAVLEAV